MSPFDDVSDRLTRRVGLLPVAAQAALFASGAESLAPRYLDWVAGTGGSVLNEVDLLRRAIDSGQRIALGETSAAARELRVGVEAATPGHPTDVDWFTAAQDCWICADTALRCSGAQLGPQPSVWYLLEPMFQSTSERRFGYTDVGSERQDQLEEQALADPILRQAVGALDAAVDLLSRAPVDRSLLARLTEGLTAIRP